MSRVFRPKKLTACSCADYAITDAVLEINDRVMVVHD